MSLSKHAVTGEVNALVQASHVRSLTDDERLRLAGLTWVPDETMEGVRLLRDRHPEAYAQVPSGTTFALATTYEPNRAAAVAAGRTVPDPSPDLVARVDHVAAEYYATKTTPVWFEDLDKRHRAAYRAAIQLPDPDINEALRVWFAWRREHAERQEFFARRAAALAGLGRAAGDGYRPEPRWDREFEDAVGGSRAWRGSLPLPD